MKDLLGIVLSFFYFFGLLFAAKFIKGNIEISRKFVHIMLGNWWFIVVACFDSVWTALVVPFSFIFINFISLKRNKKGGLLSDLERKNQQKSYGIVAYPIAMCILLIISFVILDKPFIGGIGLIALSYGDGFASLIGKRFNYIPFKVWKNKKTVSGSIGMFICTFIASSVYCLIVSTDLSYYSIIPALIVSSLLSVIIEAVTPLGLDNITVPIFATFSFYVAMLWH